ncbi:MAG: hypothetical protein MUF71_08805 [Candidatus Kapabacteria bacterium]|jgi:hypothetical protein|nr:hypothetical protein [Candidatus Kapabacteria bacterium]
MQGDTFLFAPQPETLQIFHDDIEALDDFEHIDLEVVLVLDCEVMCRNSEINFCEREPIIFDEIGGFAMMKVTGEGLRCILEHKRDFEQEQHKDIQQLESFIAKHGEEHIYVLSTF